MGKIISVEDINISSMNCLQIAYNIWKEAGTMHNGSGCDNKKVKRILTKKIKKNIQKEWERVQTCLNKNYALNKKNKIYRLSVCEKDFLQHLIDDICYKKWTEVDHSPEGKERDPWFETLEQHLSDYFIDHNIPIVSDTTWFINHSVIPNLSTFILLDMLHELNDMVRNNDYILECHLYSLKVACQNLYNQLMKLYGY